MRHLLYFVASGLAFHAGAILIVLALFFARLGHCNWQKIVARLTFVFGVILIFVSATPLSLLAYVGLASITILAWVSSFEQFRTFRSVGRSLFVAALVAWFLVIGSEYNYQRLPVINILPGAEFGVVGDSITAGIDQPGLDRWPQILAKRRSILVSDHSRAGATAKSAASLAAQVTPAEQVVLLEIGGNDLLGGTSSREFESGLDALIASLKMPGRRLIMMELPLPPTFNSYGLVQRRLARKHGVILVPKRVLMSVIQGEGATVDDLHLSALGHERMADAISRMITSASD